MCDKSTHVLSLMQITSLKVSAGHLTLSSSSHLVGFPKHKDVDKQDFWVWGGSVGFQGYGIVFGVVPLSLVSKEKHTKKWAIF